MLPPWLEQWWQSFGTGAEPKLLEVREDGEVIGVAPLRLAAGVAEFVGSADVCDYMDFLFSPGREAAFLDSLLSGLQETGVSQLRLESLRYDSPALALLPDLAGGRGLVAETERTEVSLDLKLPTSWEEYFELLPSAKQGREIRRKLRRLNEAGDVRFDSIIGTEGLQEGMDVFIEVLRKSRQDKAQFMTHRVESFFRNAARAMCEVGYLRLGVLWLDSRPVATVLCFDYNHVVYLYNSGYDPTCRDLSVGLMSKVLSIEESIHRGRKRYDFLKGAETYKYRLGGNEIPLYSCSIVLS